MRESVCVNQTLSDAQISSTKKTPGSDHFNVHLTTTFYTVGKFFCLRGGQEHRCLKLSQLQRGDGKYIYHENVSKNRNGSFRQLHLSAKLLLKLIDSRQIHQEAATRSQGQRPFLCETS